MKFKRLISVLLIGACLLGLASCGNSKNETTTKQNASTTASNLLGTDSTGAVLEGIESFLSQYGADLTASASELGFVAGSVEAVLQLGFVTDADLTAVLRPGEVSPEFTVTKDGVSALISAANPYDTDITVGDGVIASCTLESGAAEFVAGLICGKATPEQIIQSLGQPYELTEDSVVYKVFAGKTWTLGELGKLYAGFSADSMQNWELIFGIAGGVLASVKLLDPVLSYGGIEENVPEEDIEDVTYEEQVDIVEIKKSILEELTAGFAAAEIDVRVDAVTGEIILSDSILFENESYTLSESGKAYLDRVFAVYSDVLLGDEYSGNISGIVFEGHTNTLGTFDYNQDLSEKRAKAVYDHCVESDANGMNEAQRASLSEIGQTIGRAYTDPVYTESGEVDMEASRRVVLKFFVTVG